MKKNGFVVSAVLYPLLVLFLAIIMGLLSMSDTRKRILDKMKLEISDSIFDEATCSCDTILNKLNYIIKNGTGSGGGSYEHNALGLYVTAYETPTEMPVVGNHVGDIAVITMTEITRYYTSSKPPKNAVEGTVWIVLDRSSNYYIESDYSSIPISFVMQYENGKWTLKKSYVYDQNSWLPLNYIDSDTYIWNYLYKGSYETFTAPINGMYKIELWGAAGGGASNATKGAGAYTSGEIYLKTGEKLYVYVGGTGVYAGNTGGGWNGGGNPGASGGSYGGGGATDIRLVPTSSKTTWNEFASLKSRIMVAGGGGGSEGSAGGAGGGLFGKPNNNGSLSSQTQGYTFGAGCSYGSGDGSAGGGGYYGGYCPTGDVLPGGGGSSYISGHAGCASILETSSSANALEHTGSPYHYSGYYFVNTKMQEAANTDTGKATISLVQIGDKYENYDTINYHYEFYYDGQYQTWQVPVTGKYKIELWGAGACHNGGGAYTSGEIQLEKGTQLYVYLGNYGSYATGGSNIFGGGGSPGSSGGSCRGGGASDIRLVRTNALGAWNETDSLRSRIMVAAGSGGSGSSINGDAGGLLGYANNAGKQASQTSGQAFGIGCSYGSGDGSGGGGGYFGGYCPTGDVFPGGGGSSFISGHNGCNAITSSGTASGTPNHYSGYKFTNTKMIDGRGYGWTNVIGAQEGMENFINGAIIYGNKTVGHGRITLLS